FFKMFFASFLAMVVAGVILIIVAISAVVGLVSKATTSDKAATALSGNVLRIELDQQLHEQGENNSLAAFGEGSSFSAGLYDAIKAVNAAEKDENIKGIYLELGQPANNWATLQQLRSALVSFRS